MFRCKVNDKDISEYATGYTWTGDLQQAARRLDFVIAYNLKDQSFKNLDITIGDKVYLYWQQGEQAEEIEIFRGIIFFRERSTNTFTMNFTAYDKLIYLAKSKDTKKFKNIPIESVVRQVCNEMDVNISALPQIGVKVDFIADNMSYTEMIAKAFEFARAKTGQKYHMYMNQDNLCVVERNQVIENYLASDQTNVEYTQHSESIEDMINTVVIVNSNGTVIGRVSNDADLSAYGKLQDVYKVDKKQDTQTQAKALLKPVAYKSSLSGLGSVQCITGYAVTIQEEQLKGRFAIIADRHTIENNSHKMQLELEYLGEVQENAG